MFLSFGRFEYDYHGQYLFMSKRHFAFSTKELGLVMQINRPSGTALLLPCFQALRARPPSQTTARPTARVCATTLGGRDVGFAESGYFHLVPPGQDPLFRCKNFLKLALMERSGAQESIEVVAKRGRIAFRGRATSIRNLVHRSGRALYLRRSLASKNDSWATASLPPHCCPK